MQQVKNIFKKIGQHFQVPKSSHQEELRQRLLAMHADEQEVPLRLFSWMPLLSTGVVGVVCLMLVVRLSDRPSAVSEHDNDRVTSYSSVADEFLDFAGLSGSSFVSPGDDRDASDLVAVDITTRVPQPEATKSNTGAIVDYEDEYGDMLEEWVAISLLTEKGDASETVSALFASLSGHLSSIRINKDRSFISGSIPASRLNFFYEQLYGLVKSDAFIEKSMQGESITPDALNLAERMEALRAAEADATERLQAATTEEEKKIWQESLATISEEIDELAGEQDVLEDRVKYVEVSVSIEQLPSLWEVHSDHELREVIAGYDDPNVWQRIEINVLTVFVIALEMLSATFWILIPLVFIAWSIAKRRRLLRELE